jgi:hypothetical protein
VVLAVNGGERAIWLEVMQMGSVRRLELPFDSISTLVASAENGYDGDDGARLIVQCLAPPRFSKEASAGGKSGRGAFVPTADFTAGNASQVDTHAYRFARGVLEPALAKLRSFGLRFDEGESGSELVAAVAEVAAAAAAAGAARRPKPYVPRSLNTTACTPSPREQASALLEQVSASAAHARRVRAGTPCGARVELAHWLGRVCAGASRWHRWTDRQTHRYTQTDCGARRRARSLHARKASRTRRASQSNSDQRVRRESDAHSERERERESRQWLLG